MPADPFASQADTVMAPARSPFALVPHDSDELPAVPKAIYVGAGGTIVLRGIGGSADVTFSGVQTGSVLDVRASHVRATGTTAANLVGLA
jgi:hypothetical protein